jgi:hypothetical protein
MELRSHIIHLRIIYIFSATVLCRRCSVVSTREKLYSRRRVAVGWLRLFWRITNRFSNAAVLLRAHSLSRALIYLCSTGVLLIHVFQWCCCECVCHRAALVVCGTDNTRLSEKGTNRAETNPTKNGEKISHATCTWSPFAISEKTPFHWLNREMRVNYSTFKDYCGILSRKIILSSPR